MTAIGWLIGGAAFVVALIKGRKSFLSVIPVLLLFSLIMPFLTRYNPESLKMVQPIVKLGILGVSVVLWLFRSKLFGSPSKNKDIRKYLFVFVMSLIVFLIRCLVEYVNGEQVGTLVEYFQVFGFPYIFLVFIVYDEVNHLKWLSPFLFLLLVTGIIEAIYAIVQYFIGPYGLLALGMDISYGVEEFHFLIDEITGETTFRVFSTLSNHYDLSCYLTITIFAAVLLYSLDKLKTSFFVCAIVIMSFALLATQNTTSMLILILTILLWLWLNNRDEAKRLKSFFVIIRNLIIVGAIGIILVFSQEQFRDRVLSSFGIGEAHGSSMNTRIFYLYGGIASFVANPMGYGFDDSKFPFPVSRDIYLLNLLVMVGIPVFIFYICIYIYPIVHGWKYLSLELIQKNPLRTVYFLLIGWVVSSLAIGVLSNSQTTQASPSNFLFWSAVGVMYKFPKLKSIPDN